MPDLTPGFSARGIAKGVKRVATAATRPRNLRRAQRLILDERPIVRAAVASYKGEGEEYLRNVAPAVLQVAALVPAGRAAKVAMGARGLGIAERISLGATTAGARDVVLHGTTKSAAKSIARQGFRAAQGRGVYATRDLGIASTYALRRAATAASPLERPAIIAAQVRRGAVNLAGKDQPSIINTFPSALTPVRRSAAFSTGAAIGAALGASKVVQSVLSPERQERRELRRIRRRRQR